MRLFDRPEAVSALAAVGGSLPVCRADEQLVGMNTDRDITVKVIAYGKDPKATWTGDLTQGVPITI